MWQNVSYIIIPISGIVIPREGIIISYVRSTELLLGRDDADTDLSDYHGDVAGHEDVVKVKMNAGCDVSGYSGSVIDSGIWRSNRTCKHRGRPYNDVRTSDFSCEDAQKYVSWNIP